MANRDRKEVLQELVQNSFLFVKAHPHGYYYSFLCECITLNLSYRIWKSCFAKRFSGYCSSANFLQIFFTQRSIH